MTEDLEIYLINLQKSLKEFELINAGILSLNYSECQHLVEFLKFLRDDTKFRLQESEDLKHE